MQGIIQGTNRVDSWAQFVNLVQDARTRNQALAAAKNPAIAAGPAGAARITRRIMNQPAAAPLRTSYALPVARTTSMETAKQATKMIGSFFDAYA